MQISLDENLVTLAQAAKLLPGRPNISTLWRWSRRGVKGVILETLVVAGRRFTSTEALRRFASATTAAANGAPPPMRTPVRRERGIQDAERALCRYEKSPPASTAKGQGCRGKNHQALK